MALNLQRYWTVAANRSVYPLVRTIFPERWREWEKIRYDYEGIIHRSGLSGRYHWEKAEFWGPKSGVRPDAVEIVVWNGRRYRIVD